MMVDLRTIDRYSLEPHPPSPLTTRYVLWSGFSLLSLAYWTEHVFDHCMIELLTITGHGVQHCQKTNTRNEVVKMLSLCMYSQH